MADVAAVFHWSGSEMKDMPLEELLGWQRRAIRRFRQMNGHKDDG